MITKLFEIRDRHTHIIGMATKLCTETKVERNALARCGFGVTPQDQAGYVILTKIGDTPSMATYDPFGWDNRTMRTAHQHISKNFDELKSGSVIDVMFILGETTKPVASENTEGF